MAASTTFKKLLLRGIKWDAEAQTLTLADALKAAVQAKFSSSTSKGRFLSGTSQAGHAVSFTLPSHRDATPQEIAEATLELLELFEAVVAELGGSPTDDEVLTAMLAKLIPCRSVQSDFSLMER